MTEQTCTARIRRCCLFPKHPTFVVLMLVWVVNHLLLASTTSFCFAFFVRQTSTMTQLFRLNNNSNDDDTQITPTNSNILMPLKRGTTVALITPMDPITGNVQYDELRHLLQYHVRSGTDNLCILGTTGESAVLSDSERIKVLQVAVEEVKGIMPIMAGTGTINPEKVKSYTQQAHDLGCDAALVVTPYYVKPPQRGLVKHFLSMADLHNGLPVVMYNVPGRTGVNLEDTSAVLASEHPNIVALKDATGNMDRIINVQNLLGTKRNNLLLYSGDDGTTVDFLKHGGDGCISVTCNVAAKQMYDIVHTVLDYNPSSGVTKDEIISKAYEMNQKLELLHDKLFVESNPIPCKYAAMKLQLISSLYVRPPLDGMDPKYESILDEALIQAGFMVSTIQKQ